MRIPRLAIAIVAGALALFPASVLVFAGVAKLDDPFPAASFLWGTVHLRFPAAIHAARAVGVLEVGLGLAICMTLGRTRFPSLVAATLLAFFSGLLLRLLLTNHDAATCGASARS